MAPSAQNNRPKELRVSTLNFDSRARPRATSLSPAYTGIGVLCALFACSPPDPQPATSAFDADATVVATYDDGELSLADLESAIAQIPSSDRPAEKNEHLSWYQELAEQVVLNRVLLEEAMLLGIDEDDDFRRWRRTFRRDFYATQYLQHNLPQPNAVSEQETRQYYEDNANLFRIPDARAAYHIFKRTTSKNERGRIVAELERLRDLAVQGKSFRLLAEEHSESESRHRQGFLGEVRRDMLPEQLADVVFALEEGEISAPIVTRDGAHLFFNQNTIDERTFSYEEVAPSIAKRMNAQRRAKQIQQLVDSLHDADTHFIPAEKELLDLLRAGEPTTLLLRVGAFRLTLDRFRQIIAEKVRLGALAADDTPATIFRDIANREVIYHHSLSTNQSKIVGEVGRAEANRPASMTAVENMKLIEVHTRNRFVQHLKENPEILQAHFDNNRMEFSSPPSVRLTALSVPKNESASGQMGLMERAKGRLERGEQEFSNLADDLGTALEDWGWHTPSTLAARDPAAAKTAFTLSTGGYSHPYTTADQIVMFRVNESKAPRPLPFSKAYHAVLNAYLKHHSQRLFAEIKAKILQQERFHFNAETMARLLRFRSGDGQ